MFRKFFYRPGERIGHGDKALLVGIVLLVLGFGGWYFIAQILIHK